MRIIYLVLVFICPVLLSSQSIKGFKIPDSLRTKNFNQLKERFSKEFNSKNNLAEIYANCIVLKAKNENKDLNLADGYKLLHLLKNDESSIHYIDSMIVLSKKISNTYYISEAYKHKGNFYYTKGKYSIALDYYLKSKNYTKKDSETARILDFNIGLLKLELGNYKDALSLFISFEKYLENNNLTNRVDYISCLYAIAYTYNKIDQINLSENYINRGLKENEKINNKENQSNFILISGINSYKKRKFKDAIKKLEIASKIIKENHFNDQNLAISEFYIGKIFKEQNNVKFIEKFKKVDSILMKSKNLTLELREVYPFLIEHYKIASDKENQLLYIEHLLSIDSILHENKYNLSNIINTNYDTPNLLSEKQKIISDLDSQNLKLFWGIGIISVISAILILLYIKNVNKIKLYKEQAKELIKEPEKRNLEKQIEVDDKNNTKDFVSYKSNLPQDILDNLNLRFMNFEEDKKYLNRNLTMDELAKDFKTNRDYLSKAVNELKGKNFPQYINELRINYIVKQLKDNPNLQKYTIAGIAEEAGYNNSESFTNSFKKITGTLPSYYIKALQEKK